MTMHPNPFRANSAVPAEVIAQAIDRSISHGEIVTLEHSDAVAHELYQECEGHAAGAGLDGLTDEFWGVTLDGEEWRVHLERDE